MYDDLPKTQTQEAEGDDSRDSILYAENKAFQFVQIVARFYLARVSVVERGLIKVTVIKAKQR